MCTPAIGPPEAFLSFFRLLLCATQVCKVCSGLLVVHILLCVIYVTVVYSSTVQYCTACTVLYCTARLACQARWHHATWCCHDVACSARSNTCLAAAKPTSRPAMWLAGYDRGDGGMSSPFLWNEFLDSCRIHSCLFGFRWCSLCVGHTVCFPEVNLEVTGAPVCLHSAFHITRCNVPTLASATLYAPSLCNRGCSMPTQVELSCAKTRRMVRHLAFSASRMCSSTRTSHLVWCVELRSWFEACFALACCFKHKP